MVSMQLAFHIISSVIILLQIGHISSFDLPFASVCYLWYSNQYLSQGSTVGKLKSVYNANKMKCNGRQTCTCLLTFGLMSAI